MEEGRRVDVFLTRECLGEGGRGISIKRINVPFRPIRQLTHMVIFKEEEMKVESNIKKILDDHERRILHLESLIGKQRTATASKKQNNLTDHILVIREKGFFTHPKTALEVHKELHGSYHCEPDRVAMALLRLATRKELRKATKKITEKIYKAYVW